MSNNLYIFSSNRARKQFFLENFDNSFLPASKTLGEFFESILRVDGKIKIPDILRRIYLYESLKECNTHSLGEFASNFSKFLSNSDFFLKFYDELCAECVSIEYLEQFDIYAFYEDHLKILKDIFRVYHQKLTENNLYDKYFVEDYKINVELLSNYDELQVFISGFLSKFECKIFYELSKIKPIILKIKINKFSKTYYERLFNMEIDYGIVWFLIRDSKISIKAKENTQLHKQPLIMEFSNKVSLVGGIFAQIDSWLESGVVLEDICVILPNEEFVAYLKLFDTARNFNYAMGIKLKDTRIFKQLKLKADEICDIESFFRFIGEFNDSKDSSVIKKIQESWEYFKPMIPYFAQLDKEIILSFLKYIEEYTIDDVGGGRINVIGILESRDINFSHVIMPEFIEGVVPSFSNKDIFLNTTIKKEASLPTKLDRENLQKSYYLNILQNSKEVIIYTINNDDTKPSRFLLDKDVFCGKIHNASKEYDDYFVKNNFYKYSDSEIVDALNIKAISPTSLKIFLDCKRQYYYKYILGLKDEEVREHVSNAIHNALHIGFVNFLKHGNFNLLSQEVFRLIDEYGENELDKFNVSLAKKYVKDLLLYEEERYKSGYIPKFLEKEFTIDIGKITLKGRIDRIDVRGDEILVLDYKYKKNNIKSSHDFQMLFYKLAAQRFFTNKNIKVGIYDVYNAKIEYYDESKLEKEEQELLKILHDIEEIKELSFTLTDKRQVCEYCSFKYICNRY